MAECNGSAALLARSSTQEVQTQCTRSRLRESRLVLRAARFYVCTAQ